MALKITTKEEYWFTPSDQRNEKNPFKIKFKRLTTRELSVLEDNLVTLKQNDSVSFAQASYNYGAIKNALLDWQGVLDDKNKEIKLEFNSKGQVKDKYIDMIAPYINEIATVIIQLSKNPTNKDLFDGIEDA